MHVDANGCTQMRMMLWDGCSVWGGLSRRHKCTAVAQEMVPAVGTTAGAWASLGGCVRG